MCVGRAGDPEAARPLFDSAFATAIDTGQTFIAADAAHMAALVAPDRDGFIAWTEREIELATKDEDARHWLGPLYNNIGWNYYDAGEFEDALISFRRGLEAREADGEEGASVEIARYTVGKALRALGRSDEAVPPARAERRVGRDCRRARRLVPRGACPGVRGTRPRR